MRVKLPLPTLLLLGGACGHRQIIAGGGPPSPVEVTVRNLSGPLTEGDYAELELAVTNLSDDPVILTSVRLFDELAAPPSLLERRYGETVLDPATGVFKYNPMAQRETSYPFITGLLRPGQSMKLNAVCQVTEPSGEITISYYVTPYDWLFRHGYFPEEEPGPGPEVSCVRLSKVQLLKLEPGAEMLLGQTPEIARTVSASVVLPLEPAPFPLSKARKLTGVKPLSVSYSKTLGAWVFSGAGETGFVSSDKVLTLPYIHPGIFRDIDRDGLPVLVKLDAPGETSLDEQWRTEPGDGMYTVGAFIRVEPSQLLTFILTLGAEQLRLSREYYFMRNYYYVVHR